MLANIDAEMDLPDTDHPGGVIQRDTKCRDGPLG